MKKSTLRTLLIIGIFVLVLIITIIILAISTKGKDDNTMSVKPSINSDSSASNSGESVVSNENVDVEEGSYHYVSDGGSTIYAFNSVPNLVIDGAKQHIKYKGYDDNELTFVFDNSRETFGPKYVVENRIDVYDPKPLVTEYTATSAEYLFYVEETYKRTKESNSICVGYFAINEKGEIVEEKNLKTATELFEYTIEPDIGTDAITQAKNFLSINENATIRQDRCKRFIYYNEDGEAVLCYRYAFNDGNEIYINGITGDKIK